MLIVRSIVFFVVAGLLEIGGGYLVWQWLRQGKSAWLALAGAGALILYGVVPTFQTAAFGRTYAAYGGIFIVLALVWGWLVDRTAPDRFDLIGALVALAGVAIIMYWPRG